ncbi:hypothetical protein [Arthrobacter sp. L77]|uniref:hypothetical protein n=1 Tax=Arthrobacter sp. L77 TaxID=1496689 RepID=UPI0018CC89BC|nr:hypothetical protein [Arthrobacter sp. L77]
MCLGLGDGVVGDVFVAVGVPCLDARPGASAASETSAASAEAPTTGANGSSKDARPAEPRRLRARGARRPCVGVALPKEEDADRDGFWRVERDRGGGSDSSGSAALSEPNRP